MKFDRQAVSQLLAVGVEILGPAGGPGLGVGRGTSLSAGWVHVRARDDLEVLL